MIGIGIFYLSFLMKIAESALENSDTSILDSWIGCLYISIITMLTIGYGDVHPLTFMG